MNTNKIAPVEIKEDIDERIPNIAIIIQNNNFEINTDQGDVVDDKYTNSLGYTKAEYEKSKKFRMDQLVRDDDNKLFSLWVSNFELAKFGIGIYQYFSYLKIFCILFWVLTVLMIPLLISNILGGYYQDINTSVIYFTTLGNQYGFKDQTSDRNSLSFSEDSKGYRTAVVISDLLVIITLYIFLLVFKVISRYNIHKSLIKIYSPSDYACYVTGFPDDAVTEQDVK